MTPSTLLSPLLSYCADLPGFSPNAVEVAETEQRIGTMLSTSHHWERSAAEWCERAEGLHARVAELEARIAELQPMAECAAIMAVCGYFSRMRGPDDVALEALQTLRGIAGVTARAWELPRQDFIDEFLPWAQSRARYAVAKIEALLAAKAKGE